MEKGRTSSQKVYGLSRLVCRQDTPIVPSMVRITWLRFWLRLSLLQTDTSTLIPPGSNSELRKVGEETLSGVQEIKKYPEGGLCTLLNLKDTKTPYKTRLYGPCRHDPTFHLRHQESVSSPRDPLSIHRWDMGYNKVPTSVTSERLGATMSYWYPNPSSNSYLPDLTSEVSRVHICDRGPSTRNPKQSTKDLFPLTSELSVVLLL